MFYQSIEIDFGKFPILLGNGHYPIDSTKQLKTRIYNFTYDEE